MFRPPVSAILREVFLEGYVLYRTFYLIYRIIIFIII